jgi:hypothetical protein
VRLALAVCVALAAASLVLPSEPSFDPWAWIVWGREVLLLDLDTTGGPSWKPLPVLFTAIFAPSSLIDAGLPATLWLVVARAGALLSIVLAFRVARRLADGGRVRPDRSRGSRWIGIAAGTVAALALAFAPQWLRYAAHGNEVPMAVALMLWGVERHLDGRRAGALVAVFLACLLRPEVFPFVALYAAWLWHAEPALRRLTAALTLALPALWLLPDWLGSGDPLGAGRKASSEPHWSLSLRDQPWLAALERTHRIAGLPLELGTLVAALFALRRRDRTVLALAGIAVAWVALVVAMTEAGFSGSARYFVPAVVIASVLTGVAAAWSVDAAARAVGGAVDRGAGLWRGSAATDEPRRPSFAGRPAAIAGALVACAALAALSGGWTGHRIDQLDRQIELSGELAELQASLPDAVERAGGAGRVVALGPPSVNRAFQTRLAWETHLPLLDVESAGAGRGLIFSVPGSPLRGVLPPAALTAATTRRPVARAGAWLVRRRIATALAARPARARPRR